MSSASKLVTNRLAAARYVISAAQVHGAAVARAIATDVPGLSEAQARHVIERLTARLTEASARLEQAEGEYTREQSDDPAVRQQRDASATALAELLTGMRQLLLDHVSDTAVRVYGLNNPTPATADALLVTGANTLRLLQTHPLDLPKRPWLQVDGAALASEVARHVDALRSALEGLRIEERELQAAKSARDAALEDWTRVYVGVAGTLESLFRLAGRTELAARLRPTNRRASGQVAPEAEAEPQPEPLDADPAPAAEPEAV